MNYLALIGGIILVSIVLVDVSVSTLAPRGNGFVTERLRSVIWSIFLRISGGNGSKKLLNYAGLFTITSWLVGWVGMFWIGNTLIYMSDEWSIVFSGSHLPASVTDKFYFTGYILSTMGLGDLKPNGDGWEIYTSIISFSGFIIITLAITYIVPVLSAEMGKRKTSTYIHSLGTSAEDLLINGWNGKDFNNLNDHFISLTDLILEQSQNHIAYPILHNFHSHLKRESIYINLTILDEALSILFIYIPKDQKPPRQIMISLRSAISDYLTTLQNAFIDSSDNEPGLVRYNKLKKHNIPIIEDEDQGELDIEILNSRRKLLLGMLENDGWDWNSIYSKGNIDIFDVKEE